MAVGTSSEEIRWGGNELCGSRVRMGKMSAGRGGDGYEISHQCFCTDGLRFRITPPPVCMYGACGLSHRYILLYTAIIFITASSQRSMGTAAWAASVRLPVTTSFHMENEKRFGTRWRGYNLESKRSRSRSQRQKTVLSCEAWSYLRTCLVLYSKHCTAPFRTNCKLSTKSF